MEILSDIKENSFKSRARLLMFKEVRERVTKIDLQIVKGRRSTLAGSLLSTPGKFDGAAHRASIAHSDQLQMLKDKYKSMYS